MKNTHKVPSINQFLWTSCQGGKRLTIYNIFTDSEVILELTPEQFQDLIEVGVNCHDVTISNEKATT